MSSARLSATSRFGIAAASTCLLLRSLLHWQAAEIDHYVFRLEGNVLVQRKADRLANAALVTEGQRQVAQNAAVCRQ